MHFTVASAVSSGRELALKVVILPALAVLATVALAGAGLAAQSENLTPDQLLSRLQQGGLILYVRHAATDHDQSDKDVGDLTDCTQQRNLSEQGKQESEAMGAAIKALGIPIGTVATSPYCRCIDTAKIAFGRYDIQQDMRATFYTDEKETRRLGDFLREQLKKIPEAGFNTVLVGHTANLQDVTQVWPKPEGVAHVFEPLGELGFKHLGRIEPSYWKSVVKTE